MTPQKRPLGGYRFEVSCLYCEGETDLVAEAEGMAVGGAHATYRCLNCRRSFVVVVRVECLSDVRMVGELAPCGSDAAYLRHKRNGEEIDAACSAAHSRAETSRRLANPRASRAGQRLVSS